MTSTPSSPHKSQPVPVTPPSRDKSKPTSSTSARPRHSRAQSQSSSTTTTPRPLHQRRQQARSQSQSQITSTPLTFHPNADPFAHDPTHEIDSPLHFSPSKARAAAQQTQQLATVKRWLTTLLDPPLSSNTTTTSSSVTSTNSLLTKWQTEHQILTTTNPDLAAQTLKHLQELMYLNRAADERRRLVFEAKAAELERMDTSHVQSHGRDGDRDPPGPELNSPSELLCRIYTHLPPQSQDHLNSLAETAILLGYTPSASTAVPLGKDLGQAVMGYILQAQDLQGHLENLQALQRVLVKQLEGARAQLADFDDEKMVATSEAEYMHPQTTQWMRETKQIGMKIKEYKDRVAALERSRPGSERNFGKENGFVGVKDVVEMQERVNEKRKTVKQLEDKLNSLSGLPPDLEASREEVKRARSELERLKARREDLFGILAGR